MGQMAKHVPSAGGWYAFAARGLGPEIGFLVGWLYLLAIPAGMTVILLTFSFVMQDVMVNETRGLGWASSPWWLWVMLAGAFMFVLAYRGIQLAMTAAMVLGAVELFLFGALAVWMIVANSGENTLRAFDPSQAAVTQFDVLFKGLVLALLSFVGFEGAVPLAEEARDPRRTVPRAVVLGLIAIGLFVVLAGYATVVGFGFDEFADAALAAGNPWVELADIYWGVGWTLIFFAIVNSVLGLGNAVVNAAARIVYSLGRDGVLPAALGRTHPVHRTPHVAIAAIVAVGTLAALLAGWAWDLLTGIGLAAIGLLVPLLVTYLAVCASTFAFYRRERRAEFNLWLHGLLPLVGVVILLLVIFYQYVPLPPEPIVWANWFVLVGVVVGVGVLAWLRARSPGALRDAGRVVVEPDAETAPVGAAGPP
jgi:amino acid transporter